MDYIKISGNNGSMPGNDFYSFQLEIENNGLAHLKIKRGRHKEEKILEDETKKVSPENVSELLERASMLGADTYDFAGVGGPEKIMEIKLSGQKQTFTIKDENDEINRLFLQCLQLFDTGLKKRLDEIIYF